MVIGIINIYYYCYYYYYYYYYYCTPLYSTKAKRKKEKDCTAYDVKVVCLTMEI